MPLYAYKCDNCQQIIEKLESFSAEQEKDCEHCGSKKSSRRIITPSSFVLSGSGWYKDSYN